MGFGVEEQRSFRARLRSEFNARNGTTVKLGSACRNGSDFILFAVEKMGICKRSEGFDLNGFRSEQSGDLSGRVLTPSRFPIVSKNFRAGGKGKFEIVAVGRFEFE